MSAEDFLEVIENPFNPLPGSFNKVAHILLKYYASNKLKRESMKIYFHEYRRIIEMWESHESEFLMHFFTIQQVKYCRVNN